MSHHCEDEHHSHSHTAPIPTNPQQSLFQYIDDSKVVTLNGIPYPSNRQPITSTFLKSNDDRFDCSKYLQSDADNQLILHIPFTSTCKLFSIILRNNKDDDENELSTPKIVKIYKNFNKNIDFDTVKDTKPTYSIECPQDVGLPHSVDTDKNTDENTFVEYFLPRTQFNNSDSLTLFFEENWAGDEDLLMNLFYLDLRGECTGPKRDRNAVPLMTVYESAPNPAEHTKIESDKQNASLGR